MEEKFGTKELYDVSLKSTYNMKIGKKEIEENETILFFDKLEIATLDTVTSRIAATGGFENRPQVIWEQTRQINYSMRKGVLSRTSWALISNSQILEPNKTKDSLRISNRELLETDENKKVILKYLPIQLFIYDFKTGEKIKDYEVNGKELTLQKPYLNIIVDYIYEYEKDYESLVIGKRLLEGYLSLEGKIELKDDKDGLEKTGILKIPKITLVTDLSIRLGIEAQPFVGNFEMIGFPVGTRGNSSVCSITFLEENLRSDI